MQWLLLALWGAWVWRAGRDAARARRAKMALGAAACASMGAQLLLLGRAGLLGVNTALPLHLCGAMGVLTVPMLWTQSRTLYALSLLLGAPCALLALLFPAVIDCPDPLWMRLAFDQLHVAIAVAPLLLWRSGLPPPRDARCALLCLLTFLVIVCTVNRAAGTNYLFLRSPPQGTPLAFLARNGYAPYLLTLLALVLPATAALCALYQRLYVRRAQKPE